MRARMRGVTLGRALILFLKNNKLQPAGKGNERFYECLSVSIS
jgi:hypothetical protein